MVTEQQAQYFVKVLESLARALRVSCDLGRLQLFPKRPIPLNHFGEGIDV